MQRYDIVNGVTEVEGAAMETTADADEDNGSNWKLMPCTFIVSISHLQ